MNQVKVHSMVKLCVSLSIDKWEVALRLKGILVLNAEYMSMNLVTLVRQND